MERRKNGMKLSEELSNPYAKPTPYGKARITAEAAKRMLANYFSSPYAQAAGQMAKDYGGAAAYGLLGTFTGGVIDGFPYWRGNTEGFMPNTWADVAAARQFENWRRMRLFGDIQARKRKVGKAYTGGH